MLQNVRYFTSILILSLANIVFGQYSVVVVDDEYDFGLEYVQVRSQEGKEYTGDSLGTVEVDSSANYIFNCLGYETQAITFQVIKSNNFHVKMSPRVYSLDEVILEETLTNYRINEGIKQKDVIDLNGIDNEFATTTPEILEKSGFVYVQKSQMGGGSPILRGFEANRILLLVDGIRLNNAIFRSGHLQTSLTVNTNSLDKIDVLYGPGSLSYGSDALGGTINFHTRDLEFSDSNIVSGSSVLKFSTAESQKMIGGIVSIQKQKTVWDLVINYNDFEDLRSGKNTNFLDTNTWYNPEYVTTINGKDSVIVTDKDGIQRNSGYNQFDTQLKWKHKLKKNKEQKIAIQFSVSSDIPRYERLANYDYSIEDPQYAEWSYGPQRRFLGYYKFSDNKPNKLYDFSELSVSYQFFEESRVTRGYMSDIQNNRVEKVYLPGIAFSAIKGIDGIGDIQYGADAYFNKVNSSAFTYNISSNVKGELFTRYPSEGSKMLNSGAYINHVIDREKWDLHSGLRLDYIFTAFELDQAFAALGYDKVLNQNLSFSGGLGMEYYPKGNWLIKANVQSGFRAPNIDDQSKVFDSHPEEVVIPNTTLKAERSLSTELITEFKIKTIKVTGGVNYAKILNLIAVDYENVNGQDSVVYDGQLSRISANQNVGFGSIYGFFLRTVWDINVHNTLEYSHTFTQGVLIDNNPMAHIPPAYGVLKYGNKMLDNRLEHRLSINYTLRKKLEDYNTTSSDRLIYATENGMPPIIIFDYMLAYILKKWKFSGGVKNILDTHYRTFSSGINAPGRSFVFILNRSF